MTTLDQLKPGQRCRVKTVRGEGPTFRRLLEMGLVENAELKVIRYAPLGDPMEIELHGYYLSLRKEAAAMVEVNDV